MGAIAGRHISIAAPIAPIEARTAALIHRGLDLRRLPFMRIGSARDARWALMMDSGS
jgi:hypothetical protein